MNRIFHQHDLAELVHQRRKRETRRRVSGNHCRYKPHELYAVAEPWDVDEAGDVRFRGRGDEPHSRWRSPRYMPARLARTVVEVEQVTLQSLGDMSEADAVAEGFASLEAFCERWRKLHRSYNPEDLVHVVRYRVVDGARG
jgi:hypothetical protein